MEVTSAQVRVTHPVTALTISKGCLRPGPPFADLPEGSPRPRAPPERGLKDMCSQPPLEPGETLAPQCVLAVGGAAPGRDPGLSKQRKLELGLTPRLSQGRFRSALPGDNALRAPLAALFAWPLRSATGSWRGPDPPPPHVTLCCRALLLSLRTAHCQRSSTL